MSNTPTLLTATAEKVKPASFTINGAAFAAAITPAVKVASSAGYVRSVTLAFRDQRVTVAATDFETDVSIKVPVVGKKATSVAVAADRLGKFAKAFTSGDVTVDVSPEAVTFTVHDTVFTMPPLAEAPAIQLPEMTQPAELAVDRFVKAIKVTAPAASTDSVRAVLTGVLFDAGVAVATDSYRLAVYKAAPADLNGLFPAPALKVAAGVFGDETDVEFQVTDRSLLLRSAMRTMTVRRIEGEYPNWRNLLQNIPPVATVTVDRARLMASLDKVVLAAEDDTTATRIHFADDVAELTLRNIDGPRAFDPLPVTVDGDAPDVGVNGKMLRSTIGGVDSEALALRFVDALKPMVIVDAERLDAGVFMLLQMPVKLAN